MLTTANQRTQADGAAALLESDIHTVVGCPFTVGSKYSPCVRVEWNSASEKASCSSDRVLVESSIGVCYNGEGTPQGTAIVAITQRRASAL